MKRIVQMLFGLIALLVIMLTAAALLVSPNQFRPLLQDMAAEQGIALKMGNLGWTLWPRLGVSLADVSVAPLATPDAPIATFSDAGLLLAIKPLLRGEFAVDYLRLNNAQIHLVQDAAGVGNWQALIASDAAAKPPAAEPAADPASRPLVLDVARVALTNAQVRYENQADALQLEIRDINLDAQDLNLQARAFALSLGFTLALNPSEAKAPALLQVKLKQMLALDAQMTQLQIHDGRLNLSFSDQASAEAALNYRATLDNPTGALTYKGAFSLERLNARHWLKALAIELNSADAKALGALSLGSDFAGDSRGVALDNLQLQLDQTTLRGRVAINDFATSAIVGQLHLDQLNLDHYLPPASPATEVPDSEAPDTGASAAVAAPADTPLPLALLRTLQLDLGLVIDQLQIKQLQVEALDLALRAQQGKFSQTLTAKAYDGALTLNSSGTTSATALQANVAGGLSGVQLAPIMAAQALDKKLALSGAINSDINASLAGATVNQLLESINLRAAFNGAQVRLAPLNIEQRVCQAVNLITQQQIPPVQWDAFTEMRALQGNIVWQEQIITLSEVTAGVSQLSVAALGSINLARGEFNIGLPVSILDAGAAAAASHCSLTTEMQWLNRSLALLRCRGALADMNLVKDCGPDKDALLQLTADYARYKLREQHGDKMDAAEQKVAAEKLKLNDKVSEKLGVAEGEPLTVQSALGGLLRKKLNTSAASSESASAAAETVSEAPADAPSSEAPAVE